MTKPQPSTEYLYACDTLKCPYRHSVFVEAGKKPPVTIPCPRCKKVARVVSVGK